MITAEPAVVVPLENDDEDLEVGSLYKEEDEKSGRVGEIQRRPTIMLQQHAQPGQMIRRTSVALPKRRESFSSHYTHNSQHDANSNLRKHLEGFANQSNFQHHFDYSSVGGHSSPQPSSPRKRMTSRDFFSPPSGATQKKVFLNSFPTPSP